MKPSAMPASVDRSAARGVARRMRSATSDPASSMTPAPKQATSPVCHANSAAASASSPRALAASEAGSMTRKMKANSDTVLMP